MAGDKELTKLKKENRDLKTQVKQLEEKLQKAVKAQQQLEQSSMEIVGSLGEINEEKLKNESHNMLSAKNLAKVIGQLNQSKIALEEKLKKMESASIGILKSFGELNFEKKQIEERSLEAAKNMADIIYQINSDQDISSGNLQNLEHSSIEILKSFVNVNEEKLKNDSNSKDDSQELQNIIEKLKELENKK
ncbi:MAG TPA: hypothetical protein VKS21_11235 [Spirochaetota bacterium]|nr:hypothetical protein [Spirochaetota bacterium]